jgi:hypothetical protein
MQHMEDPYEAAAKAKAERVSDTPTPAQPSKGAMFLRLRDVPEGWDVRFIDTERWYAVETTITRTEFHTGGRIVEARPVPDLLPVMLPRNVVVDRAGVSGGYYDEIREACRAALVAESDQ